MSCSCIYCKASTKDEVREFINKHADADFRVYARKHLDGGLNTQERGKDSKVKMAEIISKTVEATMDNGNRQREGPVALKHFVRSPDDGYDFGSEMEPVKSFVVEETRLLYPGAKHTWLCDGKVIITWPLLLMVKLDFTQIFN